jgi:hypothetical protein
LHNKRSRQIRVFCNLIVAQRTSIYRWLSTPFDRK